MTEPAMPPRGKMVVYDRLDPALENGEYTLTIQTDVSLNGAVLNGADRHFNVEGPRFTLPPTEVAGVFPPRNARGEFSDALPHIALGRRTLPWERSADPAGRLPPTLSKPTDPPLPSGTPPWLALLLFDETGTPEATVLTNQRITDVLPASVVADLHAPNDARCDAIEVSAALLRKLLPTVLELHLLTHARQVNVDDRELSAGDSDGWFSVVMASRVPLDGHKYRACLVSVEGRSDLLSTIEPPVQKAGDTVFSPEAVEAAVLGVAAAHSNASNAASAGTVSSGASILASGFPGVRSGVAIQYLPENVIVHDPPARLVLLHSWAFECEGTGTFQQLAEHLDVGMIGEVRGDWPKVTDTGHLPLDLRDRAGALASAWYRGPLVPLPVSRDPLGPYHSADQARRISAETGLEDISYSVAFEVGRLLAASDARLAQELMRWRRGDFRKSLATLQIDRLREVMGEMLGHFPIEEVTARLLEQWTDPRIPLIDPFEMSTFASAPGLDATRLAQAWNVTPTRARQILSEQVAALAPPIDRGAVTSAGPVTLQEVARDAVGLSRLADVRTSAIERTGAFTRPGFVGKTGFGNGGLR